MAKKEKVNNIGIPGIEAPKESCSDELCPFHGGIRIRGRIFDGTVMSIKPSKTAVIMLEWRVFLPKYERFEKRRNKVYAHAATCLHIRKGDSVTIGECRPISKSKKFAVLKKLEAQR